MSDSAPLSLKQPAVPPTSYIVGGVSYPYVSTSHSAVNRSHISDVVRSEQARAQLADRALRVQRRSERQRDALSRLLENGDDDATDQVYSLFHQRRAPHDVYFKVKAQCGKNCSKDETAPSATSSQSTTPVSVSSKQTCRSIGTQVVTLPAVKSHCVVSTAHDEAPILELKEIASTSKRSDISRRYPVSWPPLRTNLRFSSDDASMSPTQLQEELNKMHANLQRDDLIERKQRILNGERVSVPICQINHRSQSQHSANVSKVNEMT